MKVFDVCVKFCNYDFNNKRIIAVQKIKVQIMVLNLLFHQIKSHLKNTYHVRDMTAFVIHYCIITHIKITIQSLYCDPMPYCDHNTDSPFLFNDFFNNPPL